MTSGQLLWAPKEALLQGPGFLWDQEPSFNRPCTASGHGRRCQGVVVLSWVCWVQWDTGNMILGYMIRSHMAMVHVAREPLQVVGWGG